MSTGGPEGLLMHWANIRDQKALPGSHIAKTHQDWQLTSGYCHNMAVVHEVLVQDGILGCHFNIGTSSSTRNR